LFWHRLALALGGCTVEELKSRMSHREAENWKRFFMINGPAGDQRLDVNFAWLRQVLLSCHVRQPPTIDDVLLKYDYKRYFEKDDEAERAQRDFDYLFKRFGANLKQKAEKSNLK